MVVWFKKIVQIIEEKYTEKSYEQEDKEVCRFLDSLSSQQLSYIEIGSGLGRFVIKIKQKYHNLDVKALEVNKDLAQFTQEKGIQTKVENFLYNTFYDNEFEIVHCAHVIEHFGYPDISRVLEELLRITKVGGYIIIRSPLMNPQFFLDIDHVRPYPPECIMDYFSNPQRQQVGIGKIEKIKVWFRHEAPVICFFPEKINKLINVLFKFSWVYLRFPFSKRTGYILVLKKN